MPKDFGKEGRKGSKGSKFPKAKAENIRLFTEFKGALTENNVHQALIRRFEVPPRYWREVPHEVDFIIQRDGVMIPVEAKAGENVRATSIQRYEKKFSAETPVMVRLSMPNLSFDGKMLSVPLFMLDQLDRPLGLVLQQEYRERKCRPAFLIPGADVLLWRRLRLV